jgi:hypothetical protein
MARPLGVQISRSIISKPALWTTEIYLVAIHCYTYCGSLFLGAKGAEREGDQSQNLDVIKREQVLCSYMEVARTCSAQKNGY